MEELTLAADGWLPKERWIVAGASKSGFATVCMKPGMALRDVGASAGCRS